MSEINVSHDFAALERRFAFAAANHRERAALYTIGRLGQDHRRQTRKIGSKSLGVAQKHLKKRVVISRRASKSDLSIHVGLNSTRLPLHLFKARRVKTGVSVRVRGQLKRYGKAEYRRKPFMRKGKVFLRETAARLPIKMLHGPGLGNVWNDPKDWKKLTDHLTARTGYHYSRRMKDLFRGY